MTRRRFAPFLLGLLLLTSVLVTRIALAHFRLDRGGLPVVVGAPDSARMLSPTRSASTASTTVRAANVATADKADPRPTMFTMSAESTAQLVEQIELNGLTEQAGLHLSASELKTFAEITSLHQAIREAYELEIASVVRTSEGNARLEIPLYAGAGEALRASYFADLRSALGETVAAEIEDKAGTQLETRFAGFGLAEQTIVVPADAAQAEEEPVLQRTLVYGPLVAGTDQPVTRHEIYFPRFENSAGHSLAILRTLLESELSVGRL